MEQTWPRGSLDRNRWVLCVITAACVIRKPLELRACWSQAGRTRGELSAEVVGHWAGREWSEYQYYEFLAVDRPLTAAEQAEVRQLSTRARITATSFTNEYHWGSFRGDPRQTTQRYYDAHLYLANWGTHQIMLRLPRTLLSPKIAEQYSVDSHIGVTATSESVFLDLTSEDDSGEWVEGAEESLSAIVGVRSELAAG